jgi:DNA-binding transcriptional ArsR family regulator
VSGSADALSRFAGLLADRSRATMCLALLDGRAWTASELAGAAHISRSTASEHISILVSAGICAEERQGRHRYVRLATAEIAQLIEDLSAALGASDRPSSLRAVRASHQLAAARTCYDHLAGTFGVALYDGLVATGRIAVDDGLSLTGEGRAWFESLAGGAALRPSSTRPLLRTCLDFTERRHHLGGSLGAVLCQQLVGRGWVVRASENRAVTVTPAGERALSELLATSRRSASWGARTR